MALPFSDNFNRADGAVGANYTTVAGTPLVTSNTYGGSTANNSCYYNGDTPNADCYAQAKFNLPSGGSEVLAIGVRLDTASFNGYYVQYQFGGGTQIIRIDAGAPTTLATLASDPTTGQVVRLEAQGSTLRVYYNGSLIGSTTDGTYSTANRTFLVQTNSGQAGSLDDFETGNLAAATLEQTHYRFRNDDGSETTATWAAAEDTPISLAKNTPVRLRVEIGATGDPANAAYKLQYRKVGDSTWRDIN